MKVFVKDISSEETLDLRHRILRPKEPIEKCIYPNDQVAEAFHLGAFIGNELVGIASFTPEKWEKSADQSKDFRLRGMATKESVRGLGAGRSLVLGSIEILKERKCDWLWCNAREVAFGFYEKLGFEYHSELFEIHPIGPHKVMALKIGQ